MKKKFYRKYVVVNSKKHPPFNVELTMVEGGEAENISFPFYISERKREQFLEDVEVLCKENGLTYQVVAR
ncbi:hypothetical protein [Pseudomonas chlororaphis]|uniref:hypothetical protein n=1 Tax=Pseudomonas chlororaphis TaxID=587753 RepID=UPI0012D36817|nr:hypothetical protein [Pseudomonas chlororaphis]